MIARKALAHVGAGSQPGSATHTWPLLSKAMPQGVAWVGVSMTLEAWADWYEFKNVQVSAMLLRVTSSAKAVRVILPLVKADARAVLMRYCFPSILCFNKTSACMIYNVPK